MKKTIFAFIISLFFCSGLCAQNLQGNPENNLPPYIKRITQFGERADFSHDGKKILFVEKTYGDVYEVELATNTIRLIT
ncbi:MAG TPA: hypothetical protein VEP89_09640, partial [Draconibacterium sp.]|nr:hypothetical protein [Draconibacterium sp.]